MTIAEKLVETVITLSQMTPLRGVGGYSCEAFAMKGVNISKYPQAEQEAAQFNAFLDHFDTPGITQWFRNKLVLDFGCGYGGKTVELACNCLAKEVCGVELFPEIVSHSSQYARFRGVDNCKFMVCSQTDIPLESESYDVVVSHDVLEHVSEPQTTVREIYRILKPGGRALIIFPPYHGMMSHHLDYITKVPALHLIFSPSTLINVINKIISSERGHLFTTPLQPAPSLSHNKNRKVLPTLNGLTSTEFARIINEFSFKIIEWKQKPLFNRYRKYLLGKIMLKFCINPLKSLGDLPRDILSSSLICILEK